MERQWGDQRADGPFLAVIGGEMGEAAEGAPARCVWAACALAGQPARSLRHATR